MSMKIKAAGRGARCSLPYSSVPEPDNCVFIALTSHLLTRKAQGSDLRTLSFVLYKAASLWESRVQGPKVSKVSHISIIFLLFYDNYEVQDTRCRFQCCNRAEMLRCKAWYYRLKTKDPKASSVLFYE